jgi:hypothetical protein
LDEINEPPAYNAVSSRDRARLDHCSDGPTLLLAQLRRRPRRLAINEPVRPFGVEPQDPITHDLQRHPADLRRFAARRPFVDGSQG